MDCIRFRVPVPTGGRFMGLFRLVGVVPALIGVAAIIGLAIRSDEVEIKLCSAAQTFAELSDECLHTTPFWSPYLVAAAMIAAGLAWMFWPKRGIGKTARLAIKGPRLHQYPPDQWYTTSFCRMAVHNHGPVDANNVRIHLLNIEPRPRHSSWLADYPYPVARVGQPIETSGCALDRGADELFQIACGWKNARGEFMAGLDTKSAFHNPTPIDPDERWELTYEVTADNAEAITFLLEMFVEGGAVAMRRRNWRGSRAATLGFSRDRYNFQTRLEELRR
jgi:hypothetical protein